jgi:polysaccharide deacetylase 2 family uncharacterized protein YibQ
MGYSRVVGQRLVERVDALSFSFLPEAPYTQELAELAFQAGHTVLAHLPMEPKDRGRDPGAGALQVNDTEESIRKKMADMLAAVPHAMGANNHMGSRFTEHGVGMRRVLGVLNAQALFFVDSFTTAGSRGGNLARQLGVPTIRRHVFLDNVQDPDSICRQFELLTQMARQQGQAVGIGHPHQAMLTALDQCGPHAFHDVALVGVRQLVR